MKSRKKCCALGHLGNTNHGSRYTQISIKLIEIEKGITGLNHSNIATINDEYGYVPSVENLGVRRSSELGDSPKKRIIKYLKTLKEMQS